MGAERRLVEIAEEAAAIHRAFPELRNRHEATRRGASHVPSPAQEDEPANGRRRRRMSAAGRARLRAALKKRWADAKKAGRKKLG
jgi:hypothetical protein